MNAENVTRIRELIDKLKNWEVAGMPPADAPLEETLEARELARWELHSRSCELPLVYLGDTIYKEWLSHEVVIHGGDYVKVIHSNERFWVRVEEADTYYLTGTVESPLTNVEPLFFGRRVHFSRRAVLEMTRLEPEEEYVPYVSDDDDEAS